MAWGVCDEAKAFAEQRVQLILDEHLQLPMDRDDRKPRVARLLQAFDEERAVARLSEDVCVEVLAFHALGICQDDPSNAQRGELGPQAAHHFRPGQGEQDIDSRTRRDVGLERAAQRHLAITSGFHGADAERAIDQRDADRLPRHDPQHVQQVSGTSIRERHAGRTVGLTFIQQDQVHGRSVRGMWSRRPDLNG